MGRKAAGLHLVAQACVDADGIRRCNNCGAEIDPVDWCYKCQDAGVACLSPHRRLRKRADAKFCDSECRSVYRSSFIRDCL